MCKWSLHCIGALQSHSKPWRPLQSTLNICRKKDQHVCMCVYMCVQSTLCIGTLQSIPYVSRKKDWNVCMCTEPLKAPRVFMKCHLYRGFANCVCMCKWSLHFIGALQSHSKPWRPLQSTLNICRKKDQHVCMCVYMCVQSTLCIGTLQSIPYVSRKKYWNVCMCTEPLKAPRVFMKCHLYRGFAKHPHICKEKDINVHLCISFGVQSS